MSKVKLLSSDCYVARLKQVSGNHYVKKKITFFCGYHKFLSHKMCDLYRCIVRSELLIIITFKSCECGELGPFEAKQRQNNFFHEGSFLSATSFCIQFECKRYKYFITFLNKKKNYNSITDSV